MANDAMYQQMSAKPGFIAALDQSGGSTPGALRAYGIPDSAWHGDEGEMFKLMHDMRVRIVTSPSFVGAKVIGAILFERTMDGDVKGKPVPAFLWQDRGVVPFLKVDKGLETEKDGVALMKPIPGLDALLERAVKLGVFGTKMRSVIMVSSIAGALGLMDSAGAVAYSTAKAGLHGFTMSVAADYATQNIRANCIVVGSVHTPMVAHLGAEARERRKNMVPMKSEGTAWDIAHGAVYLASDESRWVTGLMLPIDGGLVSLRAWPR